MPEPCAVSESITSVAGAAFREAMSRVAGHVHIVATGGPAGLSGVTATAVNSVSDNPPSLLVCLNRTSGTLGKIRENGRFSCNALAADQEGAGRAFAGEGGLEGPQRFRQTDNWDMSGSVPVLPGALASFICEVADITEVGGHVILVGTVIKAVAGPDSPPLMYHRRQYWGA
jgi:flavin reductase (DIM6/NTAB) family NADH-FMN oxidoreductase RutF